MKILNEKREREFRPVKLLSNRFTNFLAVKHRKNNVSNRFRINCNLWHFDCSSSSKQRLRQIVASAICSEDLHFDEEATLMGFSNDGRRRPHPDANKTNTEERSKSPNEVPNPIGDRIQMKLIPWNDIWTSLRVARIRGNGEMIEVFYDTLFKEALFDDNGAWAVDIKTRT
jgi:hypothetical protein